MVSSGSGVRHVWVLACIGHQLLGNRRAAKQRRRRSNSNGTTAAVQGTQVGMTFEQQTVFAALMTVSASSLICDPPFSG